MKPFIDNQAPAQSSQVVMSSQSSEAEVAAKLQQMRQWLSHTGAKAVRLRGTDWFAWATAGGSNTVLLTSEVGVADIVVTAEDALMLTDDIEADRMRDEELPAAYRLQVCRWVQLHEPQSAHDRFVATLADGGSVLSDRPQPGELPLPAIAVMHKLLLCDAEQARYRHLGQDAALAMSEVLHEAQPDWTEFQLAGAGARALYRRGIDPALILTAGERRLPLYRHPIPSAEPIGQRAMLVFCARRHGLYASLTRFVSFGKASSRQPLLLDIEAAALDACRADMPLSAIYQVLSDAYRSAGDAAAIEEHHQGGVTGYLARAAIASPASTLILQNRMALAFNPSCTGLKVEDTFLLQPSGLENLTIDPSWPATNVSGRARPLWLERQ